jgi:hypothetical protein
MLRIGFILLCLVMVSCGSKKSGEKEENGFSYETFSEKFTTASLPYDLSDTALLRNRDTVTIRSTKFYSFISDSIKNKIFGKGVKIKYTPLVKIPNAKSHTFYILKAVGGGKKAAILLSFDKNNEFVAALPYLVPDEDPTTSQETSIDKSYSISRNISQRKPNEVIADGKDVYAFDPSSKRFALIMTDPLNDANLEVINPIDTLPRKNKFSGDYVKDKNNFVSVRDGRYPNQLIVFVHRDQNSGECTGELKGPILLTSASSAIYREGGDPCVLTFRFSTSSVMLKEDEGCGSHRGLNCSFDGSFPKKKLPKSKQTTKKALKK